MPRSIISLFGLPALAAVLFFTGLVFCIILIFIYSVKTQKTKSITKLQRSLIISSIMQMCLTTIFLQAPITVLIIIIYWKIPKRIDISCLLFACVSSNCLVEFLATLYYVSPYRKFLHQKWKRVFRRVTVISFKTSIHAFAEQ